MSVPVVVGSEQWVSDSLKTLDLFAQALFEPRPDIALDRGYCLRRIQTILGELRDCLIKGEVITKNGVRTSTQAQIKELERLLALEENQS